MTRRYRHLIDTYGTNRARLLAWIPIVLVLLAACGGSGDRPAY
jgi:hypothetical protein